MKLLVKTLVCGARRRLQGKLWQAIISLMDASWHGRKRGKGEKAWSPLIPFNDISLGPPTSLCHFLVMLPPPPPTAPNLTYDFFLGDPIQASPFCSWPLPLVFYCFENNHKKWVPGTIIQLCVHPFIQPAKIYSLLLAAAVLRAGHSSELSSLLGLSKWLMVKEFAGTSMGIRAQISSTQIKVGRGSTLEGDTGGPGSRKETVSKSKAGNNRGRPGSDLWPP